jgi:hypothetical protein
MASDPNNPFKGDDVLGPQEGASMQSWLPLHLVCVQDVLDPEVVEMLVKANPAAAEV